MIEFPKEPWDTWLLIGGRGAGKTHTAARLCRHWVEQAGGPVDIAAIGGPEAPSRDLVSAIAEAFPEETNLFRTWSYVSNARSHSIGELANGSRIRVFPPDSPYLGATCFHYAVCDDVNLWPNGEATWKAIMLGLRLGDHPQIFASATARRSPLTEKLKQDADALSYAVYQDNPHLSPVCQRALDELFDEDLDGNGAA